MNCTDQILNLAASIFLVAPNKLEKLKAVIQQDEQSRNVLERFLTGSAPHVLYAIPSGSDSFSISATKPPEDKIKRKYLLFTRSDWRSPVNEANFYSQISFTEITKNSTECMYSLCNSLYRPLIERSARDPSQSHLLTPQFVDRFNSMFSELTVKVGEIQGRTLLPVPSLDIIDGADENINVLLNTSKIHTFESFVVGWTKQIGSALTEDPEIVHAAKPRAVGMDEIDFWKRRSANLSSIEAQLANPRIKSVVFSLSDMGSVYSPPFAKLMTNLELASSEASDNYKYLKRLEPLLVKLSSESLDFGALHELFDPILHNLLLIWKHSSHYNTPTRLAILLRLISNSITTQAERFINGQQIFQLLGNDEAGEAITRVGRIILTCTLFKEKYEMYKDISEQQERSGGGWRLQTSAVFEDLDGFRNHCIDLFDMVRTTMQYGRLEKLEIGGSRGAELSKYICDITRDFRQSLAEIQSLPYDIMTLENASLEVFDACFDKWCKAIKLLDKRLCYVVCTGFKDLENINQKIKFIDGFEGLWERPLLNDELNRRFTALLDDFKADLRQIHQRYMEERAAVGTNAPDSAIYVNLPPASGAIYWARSLLARAREPLGRLKQYNKMLRERTEDLKETEKLHDSIVTILEEFEHQIFASWEVDAVAVARDRLSAPLLVRDAETNLVHVNFDPTVQRLLHEVKYLKSQFRLQVPTVAVSLFERSTTYRAWTGELNKIVDQYNSVVSGLLPVEHGLLQDRIVLMDKALLSGLDGSIVWKDIDRIPSFISAAQSTVSTVGSVYSVLKGNLNKIVGITAKWSEGGPMIERPKTKPLPPDEFDANHKAQMGLRLVQVGEDGKEIHRLIRDSNEALRVSKQSPYWKAYLEFLSSVVSEGFVLAVSVSLQFLCDTFSLDSIGKSPLFELQILLRDDDEVSHDPPIRRTVGAPCLSVREIVEGWLKDFFSIATAVVRIDGGGAAGDYLSEVENHAQIQALLSHLSGLLDATENRVIAHRLEFGQYASLWTESPEEFFTKIQTNGGPLVSARVTRDFDACSSIPWTQIIQIIGINTGAAIPSVTVLDETLMKLGSLRGEVNRIVNPNDIGWIRVSSQDFKISLLQAVDNREHQILDFVEQFASQRIACLDEFMSKIGSGLGAGKGEGTSISESDLYKVMTNVKDVKLATEALPLLFDPIKNLCTLLKKHGRSLNDSLLSTLEKVPTKWSSLVRQSFDEKERILPLQNQEVDKIKIKIDSFKKEVGQFRSLFLSQCPFSAGPPVPDALRSITLYTESTRAMVDRSKDFNNLELLFDLSLSTHSDLKACEDELRLLRQVWETVDSIQSTFSEWDGMLWDKIDTDDLLSQVKDMTTRIKSMPREVKNWKIFFWLSEEVRNLATVLPLISELHSDTMRERHWTQLHRLTGSSGTGGNGFCFKDVLDMKLHRFPDDVSEIVAQSSKEFKIEKKLVSIKSTWSKMQMEFDRSRPDQVPILLNLGPVVEVLEAHSLEIMSMVGQGRFIEFCKGDVDEWSLKLKTVDAVLSIWQKVQRNWSRLEPIFLLSEDIRAQLPEDSKRFELVDKEWKDLMIISVGQLSSVIEICCGTEGREEQLAKMNVQIETCEKALNDYLEQKKKVFPRFYFVANQALLDILSNGNNPRKVSEYIGDCFDGIKALDFDPADESGKTIRGIFSKDTEYVGFNETLELTGPVEQYLCALEGHIQSQLRGILENAKSSADNWEVDKPRELWLQDYCAQLALVATQIVWTEETERAFEELEAGSESAMKDYKRICDERIEKLIRQVQQPLSSDLRNKIITIITIDVHARDVIDKFVQLKLSDASAFQWQSQLRFYWNKGKCIARICDWFTDYAYEYVGNCGRLVITPLTDRYLSLHLLPHHFL